MTVAIVLPYRDAGAFLAEAIDSVRAQTYPGWRLFAVDDGSNDDGPAIARAHAAADPRIQPVQARGRGLVRALHTGLAEARAIGAPWIARFDADDVCAPRRLELQVAALEAGADVVDSRFEALGAPREGFLRYQRWHDTIEDHVDFEREALVESPVCHPAVALRASALPADPYREGPFPEDYDLWLRLLRAGARFRKLPQRLLGWRDHGQRATRRDPRYRREGFFAVKWEHARATLLADRPRVAVWGARQGGKPWIRALTEGGWDLAGIVDIDPRVIGNRRAGVPVVAPDGLPGLGVDRVFVAVGAPGARATIGARLTALGLPHTFVAGLAG